LYLDFFDFSKKPFHITPDPEFLYLSLSHKEALSSMIYGIEERMGFIAITGETGTGKTTIIRSYLANVDTVRILPIYIFNANVTFYELLLNIFEEIGIVPTSEETSSMVNQLSLFLIEKFENDRNVALIIDDAQTMPIDTLEQLRLLSNLETTKEKLLQIVLVGQPELDDKINLQELRQLKQRITIQTSIKPLTLQECREYVLHRISKVSANAVTIFTPEALDILVEKSAGIPRILNTFCENALIAAFAYQQRTINKAIMKEVTGDYSSVTRTSKSRNNSNVVSAVKKQKTISLKTIASLVILAIFLMSSILFILYIWTDSHY